MKVKIEAKNLKRIAEIAMSANDETMFIFDQAGIKFRQMDASNISMVTGVIPRTVFTEYSVPVKEGATPEDPKDTEKVKVNLAKLMKGASMGETLEIETVGNKLNMSAVGTGVKKRMSLPLIDCSTEVFGKMPNIEPTVVAILKTAEFKRAIKELEGMTEASHVTISIENSVLTIETTGEQNSADAKFDTTSGVLIEMTGDAVKKTSSVYPLKYVNALLNAIKSEKIRVELKTNTPIIMKDTDWDVTVLLAPRISED